VLTKLELIVAISAKTHLLFFPIFIPSKGDRLFGLNRERGVIPRLYPQL
jgi:hypothetical protein